MKLINILITGLIFLTGLFYTACSDDEIGSKSSSEEITVNLAISSPAPIIQVPLLKAESNRTDFNTVNDVNVVIYYKNRPTQINYYDGSDLIDIEDGELPIVDGKSTTIRFKIYKSFSSIKVIGNLGREVTIAEAGNSPTDLEKMEVKLTEQANSFVPDKCVMYCETSNHVSISNEYMTMDANLERTLAMITVSIEAEGLYDGIEIRPTKLAVYNVPETCTLKKGNKRDKNTIFDPLDEDTQRDGYSQLVNWGVIEKSGDKIGVHNHDKGNSAVFLLENMQGTIVNSDVKKKTPELKPDASFVIVTADYKYRDPSSPGIIKYAGTINYRICLGENLENDYNVTRNTHYQLTLMLSKWAGASEGGYIESTGITNNYNEANGVSWRINMSLMNFGGETDNLNLDSHANYGMLGLVGSETVNRFNSVSFAGTDDDWMYLYNETLDKWELAKERTTVATKNMRLIYFVKPWLKSDADFPATSSDNQYRECKIGISYGPSLTHIHLITVRQWAPVEIAPGIYMERFEDQDLNNDPYWGYNGLDLSSIVGFEYADSQSDGWTNTGLLSPGSPVAENCMIKAGYVLESGFINSGTLPSFKKAGYYIPDSSELGLILNSGSYQHQVTADYYDMVDKINDYWSSTVPSDNKLTTFYWNGNTGKFEYESNRSTRKRIRCIYNPKYDE